MSGDWKSSEEIATYLTEDGQKPDITRLLLDLWQRVDDLQREVDALQQAQERTATQR
jgi:hypothetical protein